jgi:hypothetical protein
LYHFCVSKIWHSKSKNNHVKIEIINELQEITGVIAFNVKYEWPFFENN